MNLDLYLFKLINKLTGRKKIFDLIGIFFANYLVFFLVIFLFIFSLIIENFNLFLFPFLGGILSRFVGNELIYLFYKRKRPCEVLNIKPLIKKPIHPSFPSGHASFLLGLSFFLFYYNGLLAFLFLIISFLIFCFRVFSGVHWPSDILGSILVALASFYFIKLFFPL